MTFMTKEKPRIGDMISLFNNGIKINVTVYKMSEHHITFTMKDKKLWSMTWNDFFNKKEGY